MNDFLRNLASRGTGTATTVQPRLPSRFESQTPITDWPAYPPEQPNPLEPTSEERQDRRWPGIRTIMTRDEPPVSLSEKAVPAVEGARIKPTQADPEKDQIQPPPRQTQTRIQANFPEQISGDEGAVIYGTRRATHEPYASRHLTTPPAPNAEFLIRPGENPKPPNKPKLEELSSFHPWPADRERSPESIRPADTAPNLSQLTSPQAAAPTIKVTIGRVEVRAVMPAQSPPAPRPRSAEPKLTLDDYLKRRNGGGG
jgi:hypothetical protein